MGRNQQQVQGEGCVVGLEVSCEIKKCKAISGSHAIPGNRVFNLQPAESKEESGTFTFVSPPAETKPASLPADGILWGAAAAAAVGTYLAKAEERKRQEREQALRKRMEKLIRLGLKERKLSYRERVKQYTKIKEAEAKARWVAKRAEERANAALIAEYRGKENRRKTLQAVKEDILMRKQISRRRENEPEDKSSYLAPDMGWKRDDMRAAYQDRKYQGDVLDDYMEGRAWVDAALASNSRDFWTELEIKRANEGVPWNMEEILEARNRIRAGANEIENEKVIDNTYQGDVLADYMESKAWSEEHTIEALEYGSPGPEEFSYGPPPENTAFGFRLEGTKWVPGGGFDGNVDIMYFTNSKELAVFVTPSLQVGAGGGVDASLGLLFGESLPNAAAYAGPGASVGANFTPQIGLETDVTTSLTANPDGSIPTTGYLGVSFGAGGGFAENLSYTFEVYSHDFGE